MQFLDGNEAAKIIRKQARSSRRCKMAVAFWGRGAAQEFGLAEREHPFQIIMNLEMGGTNPSEAEAIMKICEANDGSSLSHRNDLHSKVYIFDDCAIVGSSNASSNGLSYQDSDGSRWLESNVIIFDKDFTNNIDIWFNNINVNKDVKSSLLVARERWEGRRVLLSYKQKDGSSIEDYISNFDHMEEEYPAYLVVSSQDLSRDGYLGLEKVKEEVGINYDVYEDFDDLPKNAYILDIEYNFSKSKINNFSYFFRSSSIADSKTIGGASLNVVRAEKNVYGMKAKSKKYWSGVVGRIVDSDYWDRECNSAVVPFSELKRFL